MLNVSGRKSRFLCVCAGGNSRSVGCAYLLKSKGHEAIAAGTDHTSPETFALLIGWADRVILTDKNLARHLPDCGGKLLVWDVGADRFFGGINQELLSLFRGYYDAAE